MNKIYQFKPYLLITQLLIIYYFLAFFSNNLNFHSTPLKQRALKKNPRNKPIKAHPPPPPINTFFFHVFFFYQAIFEPSFTMIHMCIFPQYYSGSKSLNPVRRPPLCPSMHRSQWSIGQNMADTTFDTEYSKTYFEKDIIPVSIFGYSQDQNLSMIQTSIARQQQIGT